MKNPLIKTIVFAALLILTFSFSVAAQGGKAAPLRIEFKKGASSATVSERLKNDSEMEFIFAAKKGQTAKLKISSIPKGKYASFRVSGDRYDYASEADVNYDLTFVVPETAEYIVVVQNRPSARVKSAKFVLTLAIK